MLLQLCEQKVQLLSDQGKCFVNSLATNKKVHLPRFSEKIVRPAPCNQCIIQWQGLMNQERQSKGDRIIYILSYWIQARHTCTYPSRCVTGIFHHTVRPVNIWHIYCNCNYQVEHLYIYFVQNGNRSCFSSLKRNQTYLRDVCHLSHHPYFGVANPYSI